MAIIVTQCEKDRFIRARQHKQGGFTASADSGLVSGWFSGRVADQYFSYEAGEVAFHLAIVIGGTADARPQSSRLFVREFVWPITPETIWSAMADFYRLGYRGNTISGLCRSDDGFYNFRGARVDLMCSIEEAPTGSVEHWTIAHEDGFHMDTLRRFDDLLKELANFTVNHGFVFAVRQGVTPPTYVFGKEDLEGREDQEFIPY
jgi:hypothetical protein